MTTPEPPPPTLPEDVQKAVKIVDNGAPEFSDFERYGDFLDAQRKHSRAFFTIKTALARIPELETQLAAEREKVARLESELADHNGVEKLMAAIPEAKEE